MKHRWLFTLVALALIALVLWQVVSAVPVPESLPGGDATQRSLVRIWVCSSVGGGESWLRTCLKQWEKQHPQVMTFLRSVTVDEISREDAVLPDVLLYTPGDITAPESCFAPLEAPGGLREELLRAGRWQGKQYGLPLCYGGYAIAIDSSLEPELATTPAPTTLLGHAATTAVPDAPTPGLPQAALLAPRGCGLFTLSLLAERPTLADSLTTTADVYTHFRSRQAGAALLTTGQLTALSGAFAFRVLTPSEVITDQVWFASLFPSAEDAAGQLLAWLIQPECQKLLTTQGLHTVREDLRLYASGTEAAMEHTARELSAINAYAPAADVETAAWQVWQGRITLDDALLPLL